MVNHIHRIGGHVYCGYMFLPSYRYIMQDDYERNPERTDVCKNCVKSYRKLADEVAAAEAAAGWNPNP